MRAIAVVFFGLGAVAAFAGTDSRLEAVWSLEEHVEKCPLIVIGAIKKAKRDSLEQNERGYVLDATLHVTKVLKGTASKTIEIRWNSEDVLKYKLGTKRVWLLMKNSSKIVASRSDSVRGLEDVGKIQKIIQKGAP